MKMDVLPNGDLQITVENEADKVGINEIKSRAGENDIGFLVDLLECTGWSPNGRLMYVNPADIGALTDAPIVTDDMHIEDDGTVSYVGNVWWFPDYQIRNFADDLINSGTCTFAKAPD